MPKRKHPPGKPKPKDQVNFTDPDSRIMKAGSNFVQGYNAQAAVDFQAQVIVSQDVTNQGNDGGLATGMVDQLEQRLGTFSSCSERGICARQPSTRTHS